MPASRRASRRRQQTKQGRHAAHNLPRATHSPAGDAVSHNQNCVCTTETRHPEAPMPDDTPPDASTPAEPAQVEPTSDQPAAHTSTTSSPRQILRMLVISSVIAFSLLSFPSVLPWMIAGWLIVYTFLAVRDRPAWVPLTICLTILLIRLVPRTPAMLALGVVFAAVAWMRFRDRHQPTMHAKWTIPLILVPWFAWGAMYWEHQSIITCNRPHFQFFDSSSPIVCVGDSLTDGMRPDLGYPDALDKMLDNPVINEGFSGIATRQGLDLMPRVLKHKPAVVVIELGGHDFLKGHSRASTKANLIKMIDVCRESGAEVILMEIPRGFMFDPFASLEREIAYEKDVQLIGDTWLREIVLMSPIAPPGMWLPASVRLSDDGIHSNPRGSRKIAERVAKAIAMLK
ncbi:GDSL-type esterase/lipase family protein [Aporhodopirellula aestuarii]|uniref:GDSL-type esterase/lipase family protein n=1 Tax=Aporhodopirellula aestuarii TaxID=2950107 RepID=A0ABT0UFK4_9BACT|nr:GDSL-type esterase/lipase family protein [Aporhodopirellula aestuarii]MCM2375008.1 GDSL-type esterase/lipase family protein [Aporhodopirellula aestuarii]